MYSDPDGYRPPRLVNRPIWPRLIVPLALLFGAWIVGTLVIVAARFVISLIR
jgi:hypothetical protein